MLELSGVDRLTVALQEMVSRVAAATPAAIITGQALIEGEARSRLSRHSHTAGTPTPAPPDGPPALVTGKLRSSFDLVGPTAAGAALWMSVMGPTMPYARVQELGGATGRHGATVLPARPYLRPSIEEVARTGRLAAVFHRAWSAAITA